MNKNANVLYLEAPAGVGFSKNDPNYEWSDANTAADSYEALEVWFERFE